jgi:hypothetical protein
MSEGLAAEARPKRRSAFYQVVFRKSGEAFDLGGKALIGLSGLGALLQAHGSGPVDWVGLVARACVGGVFLALGIYLLAKADET